MSRNATCGYTAINAGASPPPRVTNGAPHAAASSRIRSASTPGFAYYPFGGGARVCVGNHFAMLEAVLALATIVQHVRVRPAGSRRFSLSPSVTLRPRDGVPLVVERDR